MYTQNKSYGSEFKRIKALISLGVPFGDEFPDVDFGDTGSLFIKDFVLYFYNGSNWQAVGNGSTLSGRTGIVSGGAVTAMEGYAFKVAAVNVLINGVAYSFPETMVYSASEPEEGKRVDIIYIDSTGIHYRAGASGPEPTEPSVGIDEIKVTFIYISGDSVVLPSGDITLSGDVNGYGNGFINTRLKVVNSSVGEFKRPVKLNVDSKGRVLGVEEMELEEYENNTAALAGGLQEGDYYHLPISGDNYVVCVVKAPVEDINFDMESTGSEFEDEAALINFLTENSSFYDVVIENFSKVGNRVKAKISANIPDPTLCDLVFNYTSDVKIYSLDFLGISENIVELDLSGGNSKLINTSTPISKNVTLFGNINIISMPLTEGVENFRIYDSYISAFTQSLPNSIKIFEIRVTEFEHISINIPASLELLKLSGGKLSETEINAILIACDNAGVGEGVEIYIAGQTPAAPPSGTGATAKANLIARGATVTTD